MKNKKWIALALIISSIAIAGTDTIPTRSNGQVITAEWANVLKRVLTVDILPRNSSGVVTDLSGNLGSPSARFSGLYLADGAIGGSLIAAGAISQDKRASLPISISSSTGAFAGNESSVTPYVAAASVSITSTGRPIYVTMIPDSTGNQSYVQMMATNSMACATAIRKNGSLLVAQWTSPAATYHTVSSFSFIDTAPNVGTNTYDIGGYWGNTGVIGGGVCVYINYAKLVAIEL